MPQAHVSSTLPHHHDIMTISIPTGSSPKTPPPYVAQTLYTCIPPRATTSTTHHRPRTRCTRHHDSGQKTARRIRTLTTSVEQANPRGHNRLSRRHGYHQTRATEEYNVQYEAGRDASVHKPKESKAGTRCQYFLLRCFVCRFHAILSTKGFF